ncbi:Estradiol 17-beta-dehydrogenase 2 [Apostichopus japonicus]|uniref:Estradiol 17-beta-dehydrogenase 2 n=1 Tax=Stichopus japonicus TaxID=307972 RepID=A0A2G8KU00_STIJA|nr:Estradiol 17-beta-dehydrogenase 2 [Apostichopus japonicus]
MYALLKILRTFLRLIQVYAVIVIVANAARIRNLSNKAVLITGCDTGLGNALARTLDSIGFRVFAACLKANSPGADSLKSNCSEKLTVIQLDVTKDDDVEAARRVVEDS